ncbi:copper chaperone PCu(A)C [Rothia sp. P7181]|uniref:copper chaperone PCu(A)C n=1 Tax=Rothia sp. P7181 TaxID=3402663 RepID=UPI003AEC2904
MFKISTPKTTVLLSSVAIGALVLTGCGAQDTSNHHSQSSATPTSSADASSTATTPTETTTNASAQNSALVFSDTWVKATKGGMTAFFGKVKNTTDKPITIVSATSSISDDTQLHTTEKDPATGSTMMKQVTSFTINPGEDFVFEPGGNHIMAVGMKCSLPAGLRANVTLKTEDGQEFGFEAVARDYAGAKEEYAPGEEHTPAGSEHSHEHGEHSHEHGEHSHEHGEHSHEHGEHSHEHGEHSHEHGDSHEGMHHMDGMSESEDNSQTVLPQCAQ